VILTDAGQGDAAKDERLAYVFDRDRVRPSGLAGELFIDEATFGTGAVPPRAQVARPPFRGQLRGRTHPRTRPA
jgi:hypothetical protein